jgi:uncharacterized protein (TIGR04222 family)
VSNPLDLPGPQFLVFYAIVALLTLGLLYAARAASEAGPAPHLDVSDPYLIAYLRGGTREALRVATVTLIDRGLLQLDESRRTVVTSARFTPPQHPLEQALMRHFEQSHLATTVFGSPELKAVCHDYEQRLTALGLLPDAARRAARRQLLTAALVVLLGLALAKLGLALARGRTNVLFLIVLTVAAAVTASVVANPRLTTRGRTLLADLRRLFARLRARSAQLTRGAATADAALLAAVFGLGALPAAFAYAHMLYPRATSGSSLGSSCSASCGSSCGGGGDGGGGGCGGCGGGGGGD